MATLNQGRNEIRFNNSGGKCLLENWVEERAVKEVTPGDAQEEKEVAKILKTGHKGLLTINSDDKTTNVTTFRESYKPPVHPNVRQKGSKMEMLEKLLFEQISREVEEEFTAPPEETDYKSVTHSDFNKDDFVHTKIQPTAYHDYVSEQPVTFWTEHRDKMHGISQSKSTFDSPFRKNAAFSKPIDESYDQPKPYEHDLAPNM